MKNTCVVFLIYPNHSFPSLPAVDAGSILKVVSITQENWSTEEVVLEELQVFQVFVRLHTHTQTHKWRNTSSHTFVRCQLFSSRARLLRSYTNSATPMEFSELLINKLICCFYSNSAPTMYVYGGVKVCLLYFLQVPTPILSMEMSSKQVRPRSRWFRSHTLPTLFLHVLSALCLHSCHVHSVVCICLMWHKTYCFLNFFILNSFTYSTFPSLSLTFPIFL